MTSLRTQKITEDKGHKRTTYELDNYGITETANVYWNLNCVQDGEHTRRLSIGKYSEHRARGSCGTPAEHHHADG